MSQTSFDNHRASGFAVHRREECERKIDLRKRDLANVRDDIADLQHEEVGLERYVERLERELKKLDAPLAILADPPPGFEDAAASIERGGGM